MKKELLQLYKLIRDFYYTCRITKNPAFEKSRTEAEIVRLVHSIEKGLSLENPRMGFGIQKIHTLFRLCAVYKAKFGGNEFCLKMAYDALNEYISFHRDAGYSSEELNEICRMYTEILPCGTTENEKFGGIQTFAPSDIPLNFNELEAFFASRHSTRDFTGEKVSCEDILSAIHAAQTAPSACNRQAVRVYVISSEKLNSLYGSLEETGGFAKQADRFILITGKLSAYRLEEYKQYTVSASIFAAYLTLALHSKNIGSCLIQRPLTFNKSWNKICELCGIPCDEQLVLMLAIGKMKPSYKVPLSKRYPPDQIVKFID